MEIDESLYYIWRLTGNMKLARQLVVDYLRNNSWSSFREFCLYMHQDADLPLDLPEEAPVFEQSVFDRTIEAFFREDYKQFLENELGKVRDEL